MNATSPSSTQQNVLDRFFKLRENNTSIKTEIIAGITTFLTMVYIVFVNPSVLGAAGMDTQAVFVTTAIIAAIGSICMGLFTNLPVALAPAMGLNAYFAFTVVGKLGYPWEVAMGAVFLGSVGLFILTVAKVRYWIMNSIPLSLRVGITSGIGLFIALIGFKNAGIVISNPATLVEIGHFTSISFLLGFLSFFIIVILAAKKIHSAVLISIIITTLIALIVDPNVKFMGVVSLPPDITSVVGKVDVAGALDSALIGVIFVFMLINLFDSSGTLIGVTSKAGLAKTDGTYPNMQKSLYVDSASSMAGGLLGTSSVTAYIESSAGTSVGGRTGLTSVVAGLMFILVLFFSPLAGMVPSYATAGALIYVGVLMTSSLIEVKWDDLSESVPAFIAAVMMPFTYSITEGVAFGFFSYCIMKVGMGKFKDINLCVLVVSILFLAKFIFIG
ncbi:NCS2 family permease [Thorsellia anophelis]|uniref:Putative MFS transporter, AGZA family, xanthine/uracil permease n=1 Tax=Thorsellia anophelis DSM 18579 TaxID=1123402 RepID=A0A1I0EU23_9GAMM|nr:NCS2 family permease [Thorsellia anophelis]SET48894.1 putative MFS transporter, AGZA family, xanthine/uracil permease [Thorsellia anophelis DSM 18579]